MKRLIRDIDYNEAQETSDPEVMYNYCIDGVMNNIWINNLSIEEGRLGDGLDIAQIYLGNNENTVPESVVEALDKWLREEYEQEARELIESRDE